MLTPSYLSDVAEPLVTLWSQVENDITADIARRLVKADYLTPTAKWQIVKAREMAMSAEEIAAAVATISKKSTQTVKTLITEACSEALSKDIKQYTKAGMALEASALPEAEGIQKLVKAGSQQTQALMRNFTRTTAKTASKAFENCLDRIWLQVQSGAFSLDASITQAISELGRKGITQIAYPSGHTDQLDVAVRRAMVTGINQTACKVQLQGCAEMGTDLVEVTSHAGARPSHAEWQGKIYSLSGKSKKYKPFYETTGYGSGEGLGGWNCRHSFFPYLEGVSSPTFDRDQNGELGKSNEQVYEESQRQRALERRVRESRRECAVLDSARKAASDPVQKAELDSKFGKASVTLKSREGRLKAFYAETGRTREVDRVSVYGYNRSVSGKVTAANKLEKRRSAAKDAIRPLAGKNHTVHIPQQAVNVSGLSYDAAHVNDERMRGINAEEAKSFIDKAVVSIHVWGSYERYFSEAGAAYVNLDKAMIRTAFRSDSYTDTNQKILEEVKKHGI